MDSNLTIDEIHNYIHSLFKKYKYPWLTKNLNLRELHIWADIVSTDLDVNNALLRESISSIYWAISHVQISIGGMLISRQLIEKTSKNKGAISDLKEIPEVLGNPIPFMYFWYFDYSAIECIYRCWERITKLLQIVCFRNNEDKLYFNTLCNRINNNQVLKNNPGFGRLKRRQKQWNKIAELRNLISHDDSNPFKNIMFTAITSPILSYKGEQITTLEYTIKNVVDEIKQIKSYYLQIDNLFSLAQEFIKSI